jgi:AAA+ ATPase superfamily predicted ATPase
MEFIDRRDELALLGDHLRRDGAGLFVLYGRRRIGKTGLLERALQSVAGAAYHVGARSTIVDELRRLSATLAREWDVPLLEAQPLRSSEALMAFLAGLHGPGVLVLDEFPYLVESDPSLPGLLQAAWDAKLSAGQLKLVCCGSSTGMMEQVFLSSRSPLFGRRTGQLRLGPLLPHHLSEAFPWKLPEIVELAALFGGVPGYLGRLDPRTDLLTNIERAVLRKGEPLYEEVPFLLREELREPRVYNAVLTNIAAGARKFGEISSKVGLDRANLTRYLSTLIELGMVEREVPVMEEHPEKSRKGLYRIADPFLATWFNLVLPYKDALERGRVAEVLPQVKKRLASLLPLAVEPVLREMFGSGPLSSLVPFEPGAVGRHWGPHSEFDVVVLDRTRSRALVAEIKWTSRAVDSSLLYELERRVRSDGQLAPLHPTCLVVSRRGFVGRTGKAARGRLIDLSAP